MRSIRMRKVGWVVGIAIELEDPSPPGIAFREPGTDPPMRLEVSWKSALGILIQKPKHVDIGHAIRPLGCSFLVIDAFNQALVESSDESVEITIKGVGVGVDVDGHGEGVLVQKLKDREDHVFHVVAKVATRRKPSGCLTNVGIERDDTFWATHSSAALESLTKGANSTLGIPTMTCMSELARALSASASASNSLTLSNLLSFINCTVVLAGSGRVEILPQLHAYPSTPFAFSPLNIHIITPNNMLPNSGGGGGNGPSPILGTHTDINHDLKSAATLRRWGSGSLGTTLSLDNAINKALVESLCVSDDVGVRDGAVEERRRRGIEEGEFFGEIGVGVEAEERVDVDGERRGGLGEEGDDGDHLGVNVGSEVSSRRETGGALINVGV
ncbi:hypothetical protein G2W53_011713 [Senna tora]|uniref:Uncharacterized protein n=1 Tax=Senna tora TaxID=362788 RepID=A0A834X2S3_9FABA|nr:hypothetical protein G2W53_011713 [Senna tora]